MSVVTDNNQAKLCKSKKARIGLTDDNWMLHLNPRTESTCTKV